MAELPIPSAVYISSHLKAEAFGGMNGDPNASSLLPGQTVKRGTVGTAIMKGTQVALPANNQTRTVSAKPYPTSPGMKNPDASQAKIPGVTSRADKTGVVRPTR